MIHGDVTTYEYRRGRPPTTVEDPLLNLSLGEEEQTAAGAGDDNQEVGCLISRDAISPTIVGFPTL